MNSNLKKIIQNNRDGLVQSQKRLCDIYELMFSFEENVLCESNDGFRIKKQTYGQIKRQIECAAAALYEKIGASHNFVALEMDNCPEWIVAFWAILKSGNKPYLVNLRYPVSLTSGILKTLDVKYSVCKGESSLETESIDIDSLSKEGKVPQEIFEDEIAFSSSATSMNEVICFYSGYQISEQILNFETIIKLEPRMAKHYKGSLKQLAFLPFYHVFGLFAVYFWFTFFGRTLVFLRDMSADTILKTVKRHEVTHIFAVPVLWHTIEKNILSKAAQGGEKKLNKLQKGIKFTTALQNVLGGFGAEISKVVMHEVTDKLFGRSVMFCINGGSYIKDSALRLLNGIGYSTYNGYGMSEIGITSVELSRKPKQRNKGSIGKPFDSVEYRIDERGILQVRGSSLCTKKLVNGSEVSVDGWFNTGDKMREQNGNFYIDGRLSDIVIGENGENINPDNIEKMFSIDGAMQYSVLGLSDGASQELSLVVQVPKFISEEKLNVIKNAAYEINSTLDSASAIKKFYFTTDDLCPPNAIKVSRVQLIRKIESGEVKLVSFSDMTATAKGGKDSPFTKEVRSIMASALEVDEEKIGVNDHVFYDIGATSIQYFTLLTRLSERFSISDYKENDKYCYTLKEICEYIEKRI